VYIQVLADADSLTLSLCCRLTRLVRRPRISWLMPKIKPSVHLRQRYLTPTPPPPHLFYSDFPGPPGRAIARRELLDFMVQGKIKRGRHTDHPAGRHSIWTNQCPPPPSRHFLQAGCPSCCPTNSVKALKATSAFGSGRRRYSSP